MSIVIDKELLAQISHIEKLKAQGIRIGQATLQDMIKTYGVECVSVELGVKVRTLRSWMSGERKMDLDTIVTAIFIYPELDIIGTLYPIGRRRIEKGISSMPEHIQQDFMENADG